AVGITVAADELQQGAIGRLDHLDPLRGELGWDGGGVGIVLTLHRGRLGCSAPEQDREEPDGDERGEERALGPPLARAAVEEGHGPLLTTGFGQWGAASWANGGPAPGLRRRVGRRGANLPGGR